MTWAYVDSFIDGLAWISPGLISTGDLCARLCPLTCRNVHHCCPLRVADHPYPAQQVEMGVGTRHATAPDQGAPPRSPSDRTIPGDRIWV